MSRTKSNYTNGLLYKKVDAGNNNVCVYCGCPTTGKDHFPPLMHAHRCQSGHIIVPCCYECNSIAGDTLQISIPDRADYIKNKLYQKHKIIGSWKDPENIRLLDRIRYQGAYLFDSGTCGNIDQKNYARQKSIEAYNSSSPIEKFRHKVYSCTTGVKNRAYSRISDKKLINGQHLKLM